MARKQGSHSEITGPRVRETAGRLFARHGFAAVSMRKIAAEVGVQAGALYNYTPDKQSLLLDLMRTHMEEALEEIGKIDLSGDPKEVLRKLTNFHIRFHKNRPDEIFIAYMELRNLTPENFEIIEDLRNAYEGHYASVLEAGVAQGVFHVRDTKVATRALIALLNGINNWYRSEGRLSIDEIEEIYWDFTKGIVGAS